MPRPKKNRASKDFMLRGHRLSEPAATKLVELLGRDRVDPLSEAVRSQFPGARAMQPIDMPRRGVMHWTREGGEQLVEPESGDPICSVASLSRGPVRFIEVPEMNAATGKQEFRSLLIETGKILRRVEVALGVYLDGAVHLDNLPRPVHYVAEFTAVRRDAFKLHERLVGWSEFYAEQVRLKGGDLATLIAELASLVDVAGAVVKDFVGLPSKGAPKNTALCETIKRLRHLFRSHYQGPRTGRIKQGSFNRVGEEESRELEFVRAALLDARIIKKTDRHLPRLFLDPRCSMPHQRGEMIERVADGADRLRRKGLKIAGDQRVRKRRKAKSKAPRQKRYK